MSGAARRKRAATGQGGGAWLAIQAELSSMRSCIEETHREIAALRPMQSGRNSIANAASELDAIVGSTEAATHTILRCAERAGDIGSDLARAASAGVAVEAGQVARAAGVISEEMLNIMTACSFQDLTGQRTARVVRTLQYLEQRVGAMIGIWETGAAPAAGEDVICPDRRPDAALMQGPSDDGLGQDDVDALFADAGTGAG